MRVLVTGASGLLGINLCLMQASQYDIVGALYHAQLQGVPFKSLKADLTVDGAVEAIIDREKPDIVINCAAMAAVDQCEAMPQAAQRINTWMPGRAAARCRHHHIPLIHISTDAVFDGETGGYQETDAPNPLSVYARTKLEGEERVLDAYPDALVARVNFYGHSLSGRRSLAEFFLNNLINEVRVSGFTDVIFSPLYVRQLVKIIFSMLEKDLNGIFHVVGSEKISKYEFGCQIADRLSIDGSLIDPISFRDAGLRAARSPNLYMDISKLLDAGVVVPTLDEGLDHFIADYRDNWGEKLRSYLIMTEE